MLYAASIIPGQLFFTKANGTWGRYCSILYNKIFCGHSDVLGGALIVNNENLAEKIKKNYKFLLGLCPRHLNVGCSRGNKNNALRMKAHTENAKALASFLTNHQKINAVHYPGLVSHPQHEIAKNK